MVEEEIRLLLLLLPSISTTSGGAEEELTAEMVVVRLCLENKVIIPTDKLPELRSDLIEHVPPRPLGVQPQQRRLVLVHLQVLGERGLLRQDPAHSPVPPLLDELPALSPIEETDLDRRKTHEVVEVIRSGEGWRFREREERRRRRWDTGFVVVVEGEWDVGRECFFMEGILKVDEDVHSVGDDIENRGGKALPGVSVSNVANFGGISSERSKWKRKSIVTLALTILQVHRQSLLSGPRELEIRVQRYNCEFFGEEVEALKCALSLAALLRIWRREGVTEDNRLSTTLDEVSVYPIPAALYLVKNLLQVNFFILFCLWSRVDSFSILVLKDDSNLQYYIFAYVDAPGYQILKNLNIISTGVLYRIILKKKLSEIQWAGFILLCAGCTTAQLNSSSDQVLQTPFQGWVMAILIVTNPNSYAGHGTSKWFCRSIHRGIIKKRPSRNINVQNFWGFFHGYSLITILMILNHALSGIAVSMVMKYADNIVKVYSTSVAMLLTAVVSVFLFGFHLSLAFFLVPPFPVVKQHRLRLSIFTLHWKGAKIATIVFLPS
ncbi:hypothetical protein C3L33_19437, partial [Rhododendron williamsianum]